MLKIRAGQPPDLEILKTLSAAARAEDAEKLYMDENVLTAVLAGNLPGTVLLAFSDDTPVGYCSFSVAGSIRFGRVELTLDDLYVLPAYRKQYFGKLLVNTAVRIGSDCLCTAVRWRCTADMGQAFFAHCGAPAPSAEGHYLATVTDIPHLAAFNPTCGCRHEMKDVR